MIELAAEYTAPADRCAADAVARVAVEPHHGYGADPVTARVRERFDAMFGRCHAQLVTNGTAANVVALSAVTAGHQCVLVAPDAHLNVDECGAIERFAGVKLQPVEPLDGKVTPASIDAALGLREGPHRPLPRVVSITNATERGLVYSPAEVRAVCERAHQHGLLVHVDGARLANAVAALDVDVRELTVDAGVDLLSFGFTKNGGVLSDAVIAFDPDLFDHVDFVAKQAMQLVSRGAILAAPIDALLEDDRWLANAAHANAMARALHDALDGTVTFAAPPITNQLFARVPPAAVPKLLAVAHFYEWPGEPGLVRWVTSHATTDADIDAFAAAAHAILR